MTSKKAFRQMLAKIASDRGKPAGVRQATAAFRKALLAFGSETDENRSCAAEIGVAAIRNDERRQTGLALRRRGQLLSQILNQAEGIPVPSAVRRYTPGITQREWDAVLRLATLVFISLERD